MVVAWLAPSSVAQTQIQVIDRGGPYERFVDVGKPGFSPGDTGGYRGMSGSASVTATETEGEFVITIDLIG